MTFWPLPIPDWFWSWAQWYLGRDAFRGRARIPALRPKSAPARIPPWAWARLALIVARRPAPPPPAPLRSRALALLTAQLGVTESPPNSNECWASRWYGLVGPWCAMAASWAYATAGSTHFGAGRAYAYVPFIVRDARARVNGLRVTAAPLPGDLVTYDWEGDGVADHAGLFEEWVVPGLKFHAIEGNTAVGDDSNGGEVMRRLRPVSDVRAFVTVAE